MKEARFNKLFLHSQVDIGVLVAGVDAHLDT